MSVLAHVFERAGLATTLVALVSFDDASLGWVLALDDQGRPSRVQRMAGKPPSQVPREPLIGPVVEGETLAALGEIQAEVIIGA